MRDTPMNITWEQYEADIRKAKAEALREAAEALDNWHTGTLHGGPWDAGFTHATCMIEDRADHIEGSR